MLLAVQDVTVRYAGLVAVNKASFSLSPGEICAVIGPNGAGKTTLFNTISGHAQVSSGTIRLRGTPIENARPSQISRQGVRRTFQNGGLFPDLSVLENVLVGLHTEIASGFLPVVLGLGNARKIEREAGARAVRNLDLMGIGHLKDRLAGQLSGGQQRMVEIVRALATNPPLLLLDEPAVGLAPPMHAQLGEVIRRIAREDGVGVLLIEHAIELVMKTADRVVVMNQGSVLADGTPDQVRSDKAVLEAYLGHA